MKIFQILPRRMQFNAGKASSVELCVSEWVAGSRFRGDTTVFAEPGAAPLLDIDIHRWHPARKLVSWQTALEIRREAASRGCDLIIVQQHIATAARIAAFNAGIPVILSTHNYVEGRAEGSLARFRDRLVVHRLGQLSGITLISEATEADFQNNWPRVATPRAVVSNGFDFAAWQPCANRERLVLVVGRATAEKGLLEAAQGIAPFLGSHPDWRAVFVLAATESNPQYFEAIKNSLAVVADRAALMTSVPYGQVRDLSQRCAIAVVPSKWNEPFGRTALEAHAGGAALISSGSGGLREISGDCALYLDEVSGPEIERALRLLAADDDLRHRLAASGAARVRNLFSISGLTGPPGEGPSICERLDTFCEQVVAKFRSTSADKASLG